VGGCGDLSLEWCRENERWMWVLAWDK